MELVIEIEFRGGDQKAHQRTTANLRAVCDLLSIEMEHSYGYENTCEECQLFDSGEVLKLQLSRMVNQHHVAYTLVQIFEGHAKLASIVFHLNYSLDFSLDED